MALLLVEKWFNKDHEDTKVIMIKFISKKSVKKWVLKKKKVNGIAVQIFHLELNLWKN